MNIAEMNIEELEARSAEILTEQKDATEERLAELVAEAEEIAARKQELQDIERRKADAAAIAEGTVTPTIVESHEEKSKENIMGIDSKEYRDAFMANLQGKELTTEQRAVLADNSAYGDGYSLPTGLDTQIWDQVITAHPILADVVRLNAGMAIMVTKATPTVVTKKKDSDANAEQTLSFAKVTLVGADYHCYISLSYAEAKMSQGAMEQYLVSEVAANVGEALAKDIFAQIVTDAGSAAATKGSSNTYFECIKTALGAATHADNAVIYAPAALYYAILGETDTNGQPIERDGVVLGAPLKLDNAATKITVVDPSKFVLDVIQETSVESVRDPKEAAFVISAYMRAEGCMRNTKACAYIG